MAIYHSLDGLDPSIRKDGMYKKYVICDAAKDRKFSELAELAQSFESKSLERIFNACLRAKK